MLNPGLFVQSYYDTALKNVTNLIGEVDPEEDHSSQNSQCTGQMNFVVPQYQLVQEPMLHSVFDVSPAILDVFLRLFLTFFSAISEVFSGYF